MSSKKQPSSIQKFWSPLRIVATLFVLTLLATFGISSCNSNDESSNVSVSQPSVKVTTSRRSAVPAPAALNSLPAAVRDAELISAEGEPIKLSDYSGKVLLVNLWATWCGPCRLETPELVKLHKEYHQRGVEMVGLSTEDPEASAASVRDFVRAFNVDYRIGWASRDVSLTLMQGRESIPQSFIINRDGRIIKRFIGFRPGVEPEDTPQQLRQALEDALKG